MDSDSKIQRWAQPCVTKKQCYAGLLLKALVVVSTRHRPNIRSQPGDTTGKTALDLRIAAAVAAAEAVGSAVAAAAAAAERSDANQALAVAVEP